MEVTTLKSQKHWPAPQAGAAVRVPVLWATRPPTIMPQDSQQFLRAYSMVIIMRIKVLVKISVHGALLKKTVLNLIGLYFGMIVQMWV